MILRYLLLVGGVVLIGFAAYLFGTARSYRDRDTGATFSFVVALALLFAIEGTLALIAFAVGGQAAKWLLLTIGLLILARSLTQGLVAKVFDRGARHKSAS